MSRQLLFIALTASAVLLSACQTMEQDRRRAMGLPADLSPKADVRTIVREAPLTEDEHRLSAESMAIQEARRDCVRSNREPHTLKVQREVLTRYQGQKVERVHLHYVCDFSAG